MPGPKSWKGDKKRLKRPQSAESKRSQAQDVGRLARRVVSRPAESAPPQPTIQKAKRPQPELQRDEKRLRALNKLLRNIEGLQERLAAGDDLDEQQLDKLSRMDSVLEEMETLMAL